MLSEAKDIVMEGHVLVVMCGKSPEVCLNTSRRTGCAGDFDSRYISGLTPALTMAALCMADYFIIRLCP